ncbi:MAG: UDP-N-acetylmuramoylalanine--D-glutamate ligase [Candidatus Taylorbacteria bacterium RIFCSPHIGHO2_01_FULL_46_22b]|uniref:UDP-N-acetylmuramoylalanine--D-glutamate ligase n=1 Tax=Candidatus Taylorbacteria bacterium RIFCSPHIGHO2_01_FULL_46_22b TaxID=1802301 RepID=A0A1G2M3Z3_9BACT|nr:MAG: UDP-N-acetylmuramoylalanine--D-glutamate ligase [Candidatus Taylorbacteria bacterium RIFCSPHIGHO2_01_FULL_46_22b]
MTLKELQNKKILILGFGIEGKATLSFLKRFFPDKEIGIADQKDGLDYLKKQEEYDLVIKTAGIPRRVVTKPYTTATNIFFANTKGKVIGVTGSKGKSTTASLIYSIIKASGKKVKLVGNIGKPMLDELEGDDDSDYMYVAELSSYQLEDIEYSPHISVFTAFFPEHMDYHGGLEEYWQAKKNIIAQATKKDFFVFNPRVDRLNKLSKETKAQATPFIKELPFSRDVIPLLGDHNTDNVCAAVTVARLLSISDTVSEKAVRAFKPLPHRLELVGTFKDITFYDDAISTTPESTIAALQSLSNVQTLLLGGTDRGYDFTALAYEVILHGTSHVVLFPESGEKIKAAILKALENRKQDIPEFFETNDMKKAVEYAYTHTPEGSICLLSCASPSYSIWKNFEEKGDLFQRSIRELA